MYIAGGPIEDPRDFYGRRGLVTSLLDGAATRVLLVGLRRTGKTSVLKALERAAADQGYQPLSLQLQGAEGLRDSVADAADAFCWELGVELPESELDSAPTARLLKRVERAAARSRKQILALIDEVEVLVRLSEEGGAGDLAQLGRWLRGRGRRAVLAGSRYALRLAEPALTGEGDPFLVGFERRLLPPCLSPEQSRALLALEQRSGRGAAQLSEPEREEILSRTGGHPFLLQAICVELRERPGSVKDALRAVLSSHAATWAFLEDLQRTSPRERQALRAACLDEPLPDALVPFARSLADAGLLDPAGAPRVPLLREYLTLRGWITDEEWEGCPPQLRDDQAVPGATREPGLIRPEGAGLRYRLLKRLGSGTFGEVYAARLLGEAGFERTVAIKILRDRWQARPQIAARMRDEARILGRLRHPSIVRAEHLCEIDGRPAVVMEYVEGVDLLEVLESRPGIGLSPEIAAAIVGRVADALAQAWAASPSPGEAPLRVLHRDIKPGNLRITPFGEVKVLDFGIARADLTAREAQTEHQAPGTPDYMSPERLCGEGALHASDVYALGVVLMELLTGSWPGPPPLDPAGLHSHMAQALPGAVEGSPAALALEMMRWSPDERPNAAEVARRCWAMAASGDALRRWATSMIADLGARRPTLSPAPMGAIEETRLDLHDDSSGGRKR